MASAHKIPTTRLLALVALIVASGVLCLRAFDLFVDRAPEATFANSAEQSLTNILEPVVGEGALRVSVSGEAQSTIVILLDQTRLQPGLAEQVEAIAVSSLSNSGDTITVMPVTFAAGTLVALSPLQLAELIGLGLLCAVLTTMLIVPSREPIAQRSEPNTNPLTSRSEGIRLVAETAAPEQDGEIDRAAKLAAANPDGTARLIRSWIGAGKGTSR